MSIVADRCYGQLLTAAIKQQRVVPINRLRQIQQLLQQPVDGGINKQILSAHDITNALCGVVTCCGEMVRCRCVLPPQHHVAESHRIGEQFSGGQIRPHQRPRHS